MTAETIFVGTELLLGNIVNTNAAYIAQRLAAMGISCYYQSVVGDNEERLSKVLREAIDRSDLVILSGGLGPTQDDITKDVTAKVLDRPMYLDEATKNRIEEHFLRRGTDMPENNIRQALVPEGAIVLENDNGTAPGLIIEHPVLSVADSKEGTRKIILLPGPPLELEALWESKVEPYLKKNSHEVILSSMVKIVGRAESEVAEICADLINSSNKDVTVAPYSKTAEVHLRVTAKAADEKEAKKKIKPVVKDIKGRLGDSVYTTHEETTLEQAVVDLLLANNLTVTTIESCTGGMVAARLINVPGVSEIFKSGFITYSNKAKRKIVGVKKKTLEKYTAVSAQVVSEMVSGIPIFNLNRADVAVAVSGYAGPDGGTKEHPVGTVFIAVNVCGVISVKEYHFKGSRQKIRESAVAEALILMRQSILEYYSRMMSNPQE